MADETADDALREMAQHRGFKLVKSRRRKPGVGDYGKYGLTDGSDKALLGIGEDGLSATAEEIEDYLRAGAAGTWRQSAETVPDRPAQRAKKKTSGADQVDEPVKRARAVAQKDSATGFERNRAAAPREAEIRTRVEQQTQPDPISELKLVIRTAQPTDAAALACILSQISGINIDADSVAENMTAARKNSGGTVLAEKGDVIGCCSWSVLTTIHRGRIGRIAAIIVDEKHRRTGIGRRLLEAALAEIAKAKCLVVEAMSDIDLKNSHNFFRSTGFDQTSYRFKRKSD